MGSLLLLLACGSASGTKATVAIPSPHASRALANTTSVKESQPTMPTTWKNSSARPPALAQVDLPSPPRSGDSEVKVLQRIVMLEETLVKLRVSDANHALTLRQLAEAYGDLGLVNTEKARRLTAERDTALAQHSPAAELETQRHQASASRRKAQDRAAMLYRRLVDLHPQDPHNDEALYFLGCEYESRIPTDGNDPSQLARQREGTARAQATYAELIERYPSSEFAPVASLASGDISFDEAAAGRLDWSVPIEAYERSASSGQPQKNRYFAFAEYKLGFALWNRGDRKQAFAAFSQALTAARRDPTAPGAVVIVGDALTAISEL